MLSATSDSVAAKDKMFATRVTAVFERAVFDSDLGSADKRDMALAYLDYLQECAASVTQIKTVKSRLRESGLLKGPPAREDDLPTGPALGKRKRTE